ncbi:hypothetical protein CTAYLR_004519 [Chrysophaeum taylorii]|uniref:PPPDE domain-containing protein n=1 Tax=Chrysophaeum taylorii TaxID=2483200 RepID=A0AAD7XRG7_9STRA|nr:hypothetical protein CTAYLR_004519 [Chrysophaeum taylorii]
MPETPHHQGVYGGWAESLSSKQATEFWEPGVPLGPAVRLNVYDLADIGVCIDLSEALSSLNKRTLGMWEVGIFHAGVEISGVEYSFGYCEYGTGVYACEPRQAGGATFRTSIKMGRARYTARMVEARLAAMAATWSGASYSLIHKNCCHFCDALCESLGVGNAPAWVNGLAQTLARVSLWSPLPQTLAQRARDHAAFRRPEEEQKRHELWLLPFCAGFSSCFSDDARVLDDDDDRQVTVLYTSKKPDADLWQRVQCCGEPTDVRPDDAKKKKTKPDEPTSLDVFFKTLADEQQQQHHHQLRDDHDELPPKDEEDDDDLCCVTRKNKNDEKPPPSSPRRHRRSKFSAKIASFTTTTTTSKKSRKAAF